MLTTWKTGRRLLSERLDERALPLDDFLQQMLHEQPRVACRGTAVFMYGNPDGTPPALLHNLKHNTGAARERRLPRGRDEDVPHVAAAERVAVRPLGSGVWSMRLCYGFMDEVDVPAALSMLNGNSTLRARPMDTTYFLGREKLVGGRRTKDMDVWRQQLFVFMSHNSRSPTDFFKLPPNRVVELGAHIEL